MPTINSSNTMVATMEAVGDGGWQLLTLMRVSPFVPFNAQNYILGLTRVRMRDFLVSTLLGMIPGTIGMSTPSARA